MLSGIIFRIVPPGAAGAGRRAVTSAGGATGSVSRSGIAGQVSGASIAAPIIAVIRSSASRVTEKP